MPAASRPAAGLIAMTSRRRFGAVRKLPSGRWQARYHDAAGNRFTAPETFPTKTEAQRWLSAAETDIGRGDWHDPRLADVGFDDWVERWMAIKTPQLAPSTVVLYRYLLRNHILPDLGPMQVGRITTVDVQRWLARLHRTHLSANTVAKAYRILKMSLDGAVDAGLIARNPCRIKGAGTERATEMSIATPEQVAALAAAVGPRWEALIFTAAYSGLRWGEMAALRRRDVDLDRRTLRVTRKLAEVNGDLSFGPPKTAAGRRTVGIPMFVANSLDVHLAHFSEPGDDGLVFPAPKAVRCDAATSVAGSGYRPPRRSASRASASTTCATRPPRSPPHPVPASGRSWPGSATPRPLRRSATST